MAEKTGEDVFNGAAARLAARLGRAPKIVHVVRQYRPNRGGLEDVVAQLASAQVAAGWDVRVVTLDRLFRTPEVRLAAREVVDGIPVERVPWRGSTRYPFAPAVLGRLGDADLVHVHAVDFLYDYLATTRVLHRKPLVATTHGGFFHTTAHSKLKRLWFNGPTRLTTARYDAVVACGVSDAEQFRPIAGRRLVTIDNGVDLGKFARAASPIPVKRLITIGRFSDNKHLERLIAAMAVLGRRDPDWRLTIAGATSDWTKPRLDAEAERLGVGALVSVEVDVPNDALRTRIGEASLFVSASTYEGFGLALIEAMSAGLVPVVHPNASFQVLAARHAGITLADFAAPEQAATAIEQRFAGLVATPEATPAALIAETAGYAWEAVAARYAEVYARVLGAA